MTRQHQDPFPVQDPQTPCAKQARELLDRAKELDAQADAIEREARTAEGRVRDAQAALMEHLRTARLERREADREKPLTTALRKAQEHAQEPWAERASATRQAATAAWGEAFTFVRANGLTLLDEELRPQAEAARQHVERAATELHAAIQEWHAVHNRVRTMVAHVPGLQPGDVTLSTWASDLARGLDHLSIEGGVPAPFVKHRAMEGARTGERPTFEPTGGDIEHRRRVA
jgi:hypothetical protein